MPDEKREFESGINEVLTCLDLALDQGQIGSLYAHYSLLKRWNQRINLTSLDRPEDVIWKHFGESLAVAKVIGPGDGLVVDVGSGGGFPGVPVAVCWPLRTVVLVESIGKKAVFLQEVARGCRNLKVFGGRVETFVGSAEWIVVRAVALGEIGPRFGVIATQAALLLSSSQVEGAKHLFMGQRPAEVPLPWNNGVRILAGELRVT